MKIKKFRTTTHLCPLIEFSDDTPIYFFWGASLFLQMMRSLIDGEDSEPIREGKEIIFESCVSFNEGGENYDLCGVLCNDQSFFAAVRDKDGFSAEKTEKCIEMLKKKASDKLNFFRKGHKYAYNDGFLSESDYFIENFRAFLCVLKEETEKGDTRPIFISNFFERIDAAVDITPFLDTLAGLGRQVFVSVTKSYPYEKMGHSKVQIIERS